MNWLTGAIRRDQSNSHEALFYFYFDRASKITAEKLEKELILQGFSTDLHWLEYEDGVWSLVVRKSVSGLSEVRKLAEAFNTLAKEHGGEYDGHEIEV